MLAQAVQTGLFVVDRQYVWHNKDNIKITDCAKYKASFDLNKNIKILYNHAFFCAIMLESTLTTIHFSKSAVDCGAQSTCQLP